MEFPLTLGLQKNRLATDSNIRQTKEFVFSC